jgi:hypothetical protein
VSTPTNDAAPADKPRANWDGDGYLSDVPAAEESLESKTATIPQVAVPAPAQQRPASTGSSRRTRKARLRLARIDPWSAMKTTFLFSIAAGIMFWVATYVLWSVLQASGLFDAVNKVLVDILSSPQDQTPIRIEDYLNTNKVLGITAMVAVINVLIITALGTVFAFLYNLAANVIGGLELTFAED